MTARHSIRAKPGEFFIAKSPLRRAQGQSEPAIPLLYLAKLSLTSETRRAAIAKAANMRLGETIYANPLYEIDLGFEKVDMTFLVVHERATKTSFLSIYPLELPCRRYM